MASRLALDLKISCTDIRGGHRCKQKGRAERGLNIGDSPLTRSMARAF